MRAKLTKRIIDTAAAADRDLWIWDDTVQGFGLRVRPTGRKVYLVEYRPGAGGRNAPKRRYVIGAHGSPWTPDSARAEALKVLGAVKAGGDPAAERSAARGRQGETVAEVVAEFIAKYAQRRQRTWRETERVFNRDFLPTLGKRPIKELTRQDIVRLIDKRADDAPIAANRLLAYVRKFFAWSVERGYLEANPAAGIKPPGEAKSRDRVLDDAELVEVWQAAEKIGGQWSPLAKLLILTGQRRSEVVGARWSEFDLEAGEWRITAERAKNRQAHLVPLPPAAVALIAPLPRTSYRNESGRVVESDFLFTTNGRTPVSGLSKFKRTLDATITAARIEAAGKDTDSVSPMTHWTFHDLRRTMATGMQRLGIRLEAIEAALNHISGSRAGIVGTYQRHAWSEEKRAALAAWERHVLALVEGKEPAGNVVALAGMKGAA